MNLGRTFLPGKLTGNANMLWPPQNHVLNKIRWHLLWSYNWSTFLFAILSLTDVHIQRHSLSKYLDGKKSIGGVEITD